MTRCEDFYEKWEKVPNWCEKTKGAVSRINKYFELVEELEAKHNINRELTFGNLSEGAARPLMKLEGDIKEKTLSVLSEKIKAIEATPETKKWKLQNKDVARLIDDVTNDVYPETLPQDELNKQIRGEVDMLAHDNYELDTLFRLRTDTLAAVRADHIDDVNDLVKRERCYSYISDIRDICNKALAERAPVIFDEVREETETPLLDEATVAKWQLSE